MTVIPFVFIANTQKDGSEWSNRLRDDLIADEIACWRDDPTDTDAEIPAEVKLQIANRTHVVIIAARPDYLEMEKLVRWWPTAFERPEEPESQQREPGLSERYRPYLWNEIFSLLLTDEQVPRYILEYREVDFRDWDGAVQKLQQRLKTIDRRDRRETGSKLYPPFFSVPILVVSDNPATTRDIEVWLLAEPAFDIVGHATDADAAIRLAADTLPFLTLIDYDTANYDANALSRKLTMDVNRGMTAVIMISRTPIEDHKLMRQMMLAGTRQFIALLDGKEALIDALVTVASIQ